MRRITATLLFLLTFLSIEAYAFFSFTGTSGSDEIDLVANIGQFEVELASGVIRVDLMSAPYDVDASSGGAIYVDTGFFGFIEYTSQFDPLLTGIHSNYIVSVPSEGPVTFSVLYRDEFGNLPSTGYPNVSYWPSGSPASSTTIVMTFISTASAALGDDYRLYRSTITLSKGLYSYQYKGATAYSISEFTLDLSSFAVTERPAGFTNTGLAADVKVANAKVSFAWASSDPEGGSLSYRLYCGKTPSTLLLIYEGANNHFDASSLDPSQVYYWQVESIDQYGAASLSPVYSFTTIATISKPFNYPNPFNPVRQPTKIAYNMEEAGSADMKLYTELGDLCWQKSLQSLSQGVNEELFYGRDDNGNLLYNGTYVCVIEKRYPSRTQRESCRLLIIK